MHVCLNMLAANAIPTANRYQNTSMWLPDTSRNLLRYVAAYRFDGCWYTIHYTRLYGSDSLSVSQRCDSWDSGSADDSIFCRDVFRIEKDICKLKNNEHLWMDSHNRILIEFTVSCENKNKCWSTTKSCRWTYFRKSQSSLFMIPSWNSQSVPTIFPSTL